MILVRERLDLSGAIPDAIIIEHAGYEGLQMLDLGTRWGLVSLLPVQAWMDHLKACLETWAPAVPLTERLEVGTGGFGVPTYLRKACGLPTGTEVDDKRDWETDLERQQREADVVRLTDRGN